MARCVPSDGSPRGTCLINSRSNLRFDRNLAVNLTLALATAQVLAAPLPLFIPMKLDLVKSKCPFKKPSHKNDQTPLTPNPFTPLPQIPLKKLNEASSEVKTAISGSVTP